MESNNEKKQNDSLEDMEEENEEEYENEESDSIEETKRIFVSIRIRPFNSFEQKLEQKTPFKSINTENNSLICKKIIILIVSNPKI